MSFTEQRAAIHEAALRLLAVRERAQAELRTRLLQKGYAPDVVEGELERLRDSGLQDDARFAERFAESGAIRGKGARRIQGELLRKGLDRELAAQASTTHPDEERERARDFARVRASRMISLEPQVRTRRLLGLLARRGYPADICRSVATEFGSGTIDDDDD